MFHGFIRGHLARPDQSSLALLLCLCLGVERFFVSSFRSRRSQIHELPTVSQPGRNVFDDEYFSPSRRDFPRLLGDRRYGGHRQKLNTGANKW